MATVVSLINMKGGVGKTTMCFNFAWYSAWQANLKVLAIDIDPQSNLSQYFMGAKKYKSYIANQNKTIVDLFEQFSVLTNLHGSPTPLNTDDLIVNLRNWPDGSSLDFLPSKLELAWTLKNPTNKDHLLAQFISDVSDQYNLRFFSRLVVGKSLYDLQ